MVCFISKLSCCIVHFRLPLILIYMCQCGFYIYSIAALLTWETRRRDFSVMMSHHVVTVILIAYSYMARFFRIGAVILALHDASDVFLEAAKVFKYSENELGASVCFGLFAISWFTLRLVLFPFWVIRSSSYYSCEVLNLSEPYHIAIYYVFNTMLLMLLVFHVYWWILICLMIRRQLKNRGKVGEDIRSGRHLIVIDEILYNIPCPRFVSYNRKSTFLALLCFIASIIDGSFPRSVMGKVVNSRVMASNGLIRVILYAKPSIIFGVFRK
ncbi:LAG1 longevity assurance homolog 2-like [Olea europaea var. sylvestris]|uniref:LAG1 longevity assurance homolog 2-like n=1 Tax=Olea europaea var. sylvestris TaxID=158386 RepID=UPI000C1D1246|nr:LAG1 longevity assurance homolog 2-like [Olea europaea var. sylvestris]